MKWLDFLERRLKERIGPYSLNALVQRKPLENFPPLSGMPHVCHVEFLVSGIFQAGKPGFEILRNRIGTCGAPC